MMDLFEALGLNHDDPEVIAAQEDVAEYEAVITELVEARKASGISQQQVANDLHTSQPVISELERLAGNPTVSRLMEYARAVGQRLRLRTCDPKEDEAKAKPSMVEYRVIVVKQETALVHEGFSTSGGENMPFAAIDPGWQRRSSGTYTLDA